MTDPGIVIVGAGAAGLATAIFARRLNPDRRVTVLDGHPKPGAKILVSGGGRCNVTNTRVSAADYNGGSRHAIALVLKALRVDATIAFFQELGIRLHEEADGKLFPDSNRARDVLDALLKELRRSGAELRAGCRALAVVPSDRGFLIETSQGPMSAAHVVLATGGLSLPRTGSDGWGYELARRLGHRIVPTTPGLVPLTLADEPGAIHRTLSGVSLSVALELLIQGRVDERIRGALLWTHTGVSGPAALDVSRHWLRADLEGRAPSLRASFCPDRPFESLERDWIALQEARPRLGVDRALAQFVPRALAMTIAAARMGAPATVGSLPRSDRRRLLQALREWPFAVTGSRGYNVAEVTAGGVDLADISPRSMESRVCPRLFLVGEVLDVDGRLGGFNFQWAWASARMAAETLAARQ